MFMVNVGVYIDIPVTWMRHGLLISTSDNLEDENLYIGFFLLIAKLPTCCSKCLLVGGWTNVEPPIREICSSNWKSCAIFGVKIKKYLKPPSLVLFSHTVDGRNPANHHGCVKPRKHTTSTSKWSPSQDVIDPNHILGYRKPTEASPSITS